MKPKSTLRARVLAGSIAAMLAVQSAQAVPHLWDAGGGDALWSTALNWSDDALQTFAAGDAFDLSILNISAASTSTVDASTTLGIITIGDTDGTHSWLLDSTGGAVLTLDNSGAGAQINQTATSFGDTISVTLALADALNITNASTTVLTISSGITAVGGARTISNLGTGGTILSGVVGDGGGTVSVVQNNATGALTLGNTNTYSGQTTVTLGTLNASATDALGTGATLLVNGGTLALSTFSSTVGAVTLTSGSITGSGTLTGTSYAVNNASGTTTISAILGSGTATLTKDGAGTLLLSNANSYTGNTTVTDGRLIATSGSALGSGALTVDADKSFVYRPTAAGSLTIGGTLNLGNGTTTNIGTALGGAASQSVIAVTGAASLLGTGVVNINLIPGVALTLGSNDLITAASGLDGGTYTLGAVFNNTNFTVSGLTRTPGAISVTTTAATALSGNVLWKGGLAGNTGVWAASTGVSGGSSNWQVTNGVDQPIAPGAAANLVFSAATSPGTMAGMTLGADMTLGSLTVNNIATNFGLGADGSTLTLTPATPTTGLTINAGVLASTIGANVVLGAAQTWTNNSANALTVSGIIGGANNFTKAGTGTLALTAANTYTGATAINGGTITLNGSLNGTTGTALTFTGTGTFNVAEATGSTQGMDALTLSAGDGTVISTAAGATSIATLTFASLATRAAGATANFTLATNTTSTGGTPNKIVFTDTTNVPLASGSNNAGLFFGGANYARYDAAGFVRAVSYGTDTNAPTALTGTGVTSLGTTTAATDVQFTGSAKTPTSNSAATASAANTNTLPVANGGDFTVGQIITGTNIANNTYIASISGNTLTLINPGVVNSIGTAVAANTPLTQYNSVTTQPTASVNTINLSGTGASLFLDSGATLSVDGILRSGAVTSGMISGGTGIQTATSGGDMVIRMNAAADNLIVLAPILDNGTSKLTISGAGNLFLAAANTYAGGTFLNGGTVRISDASSFGDSAGTVTVAGTSRINASGSTTYGNPIVVNSGTTLTLQAPTTANNINTTATFTGALTGSGHIFLPNSGNNAAQGILHFTNDANTFTGNVVLSASGSGDEHFKFNSIGDGGNFTFAKNGNRQLITYAGNPDITFNTRQIVVAATMLNGGTTDRQGMDGGGSNPVSMFANDGAGTVTFPSTNNMLVNNITSAYGVLYFGGTNSGDNTFGGNISDTSGTTKLCIGKFGSGTWILSGSNTYEGNTLIAGGTLSINTIANAATPQPLGIGPAIQLGVGNSGATGTLSYTGGTASTDKQVQIGSPINTLNQAAAGSILNNGSGALTFTNSTFNPTSTSYVIPGTGTAIPGYVTATRTLTLGGTYADGTNEVQGVIQNNSSVSATGAGLVALTVSGSAWKLSGANTYTGLTTVSGGTLQLANARALGFGGLQRNVTTNGTTVSSGGSLDLNGTTGISEPITLSGFSSTALVNNNTGVAASIGSGIAGIQLGAATTGTGYSAPPTITINGTGTGATAVATLGVTTATFGAATLTGTRTGNVTTVISGGGGTGATATVTLAGVLTITHPGMGYTSAPTITVTVAGGTITYTPNANNFTVSAVQMTNAGSGYTGTPTYTFDSGNATPGSVPRSAVVLSANSSIGGAGDMTIDAVVSQSGGTQELTKVGVGTLTLTAANTYTGVTTVSEGTLNINGTLGAGANVVNANATTNFGVSQTLGGLNIGDGAVVTLGSVAMAPTEGEGAAAFAGFGAFGAEFGADGGASSVAAVPEPGSAALLLGGLATLLGLRRRKA